MPCGPKSYAVAVPGRAVIVMTVGVVSAPCGIVTVTPACGMLSVSPAQPTVCVTVMGAASAVVRWRTGMRWRLLRRLPTRSADGASGAATRVVGEVAGSLEHAALNATATARRPGRRRGLIMLLRERVRKDGKGPRCSVQSSSLDRDKRQC